MKLQDIELQNDKYYFLCVAGLGDTMLACGFRKAFEEKYNGKIHFLIKKSQEIVMKMYQITDFTIINMDKLDLIGIGTQTPSPAKGQIFPAHPCYIPSLKSFFNPIYFQYSNVRFKDWFLQFLKLDKDAQFEEPTNYPVMSDNFKAKVNKIAPVEKIVMFCPEATSVLPLDEIFWEYKAKEMAAQGYTVISNVTKPRKCVTGTVYLEMTTEEAVTLAMECSAVYSLRSGFCDLIYKKGKDLNVYYTNHAAYYIFNLNVLFSRNDINEFIDNYGLERKILAEQNGFKISEISLFNLPILKIVNDFEQTQMYLFGSIPLMKIKKS